MEMKPIAKALGIEEYPECFDVIYAALKEDSAPACDLKLVDEAQDRFEAFGKHYELVRNGVAQINADPVYSAWVKVVYTYMCDEKWGRYQDIPVLPLSGTPKQDMTMLATLIPFIPNAAATYEKGGFNREEIAGYLQSYGSCLSSTNTRTGHVGLDLTYFRWLHRFAFAEIFRVHGIQFEFTRLKDAAAYLRNRSSGQVIPVMTAGRIHATGKQCVGAGGYEDTTGAYEAIFTETEDSFSGYGVFDCVIDKEIRVFPKAQWELIARPGDKCLAMHLPKGADIKKENVQRACAAAFEIIGKSYPDYIGAPVQCASWLLDPGVEDLLGPDSNVVRFGKMFARCPGKSPGRAANSFVFPGRYEKDEDLPEDTRLQRALKQHYLNGGYSYGYTGMLIL